MIADAKTKVYGDADPSLTYQVSGLKNGDSAGSILTGGLNRAAGENAGVQLGLFGLARFQALGICNCQFQGFAQFAGVGMQLACNAAGVVELGELMQYSHSR